MHSVLRTVTHGSSSDFPSTSPFWTYSRVAGGLQTRSGDAPVAVCADQALGNDEAKPLQPHADAVLVATGNPANDALDVFDASMV